MGSLFSAVMPGLRHARTPLVAGYAWLLFIWLLIGGDGVYPSSKSEWVAEQRVAVILDALPLAGRLVLISALAFLIGTLIPAPRWPSFVRPVNIAQALRDQMIVGYDDGFQGWLRHVWATNMLARKPRTADDRALGDFAELVGEEVESSRDTRFKTVLADASLPPALRRRITPVHDAEAGEDTGYPDPEVDDVLGEDDEWLMEDTRLRRWGHRLFPWAFSPVDVEGEYDDEIVASEVAGDDPNEYDDDEYDEYEAIYQSEEYLADRQPLDGYQLARLIRWSFDDEYDGLVAGLPERQAAEVDRLKAEAEFRLHLWLPLTCAIVAGAHDSTDWLLLLLVAPGALLVDGLRAKRESRLRVVTALAHGLVKSPAVEFFRALPPESSATTERYWAARGWAVERMAKAKSRARRSIRRMRRKLKKETSDGQDPTVA